MADGPMRVTVWGENVHDREDPVTMELYADGVHGAVADAVREHLGAAAEVRIATLEQPEHGLPADVLDSTDVLTWWGHVAHDKVDDEVVARVCDRVNGGMGLIVLHSGHASKVFTRLMGTTGSLRWRDADEREVVWTVAPGHPVTEGVPEVFVIPEHEMYGEFFDIPQPDELVFISSFAGGEVFRSGCAWRRGRGRVFYFSPGHERNPIYHQPEVRRVLANAVRWVHAPAVERRYGTQGMPNAPRGWFEGG